MKSDNFIRLFKPKTLIFTQSIKFDNQVLVQLEINVNMIKTLLIKF